MKIYLLLILFSINLLAECTLKSSTVTNNSDFSDCDIDVTNELLSKYRPVLMLPQGTDTTKSKAGEMPLRVSDLLREGKLYDLEWINEEIDYSETLGNTFDRDYLTESDAERLLIENNCDSVTDECIELRIENDDLVDNWRNFTSIPSVYGRVVNDSYKSDNFTILQYWLFYSGSTLPSGEDHHHEGDVEFFQVILDSNKNPVGASTGQHYYGEARDWNEVEKDGDNPVIYIAAGSHATMFTNKDVETGKDNFGFLARENNGKLQLPNTVDIASKSTIRIIPSIIQKDSENIIFTWNGRYGEFVISAIPGKDGPPSPKYRGPNNDIGLSMFNSPIKYHFTFLMPGENYAGFMEHLARSRNESEEIKKVLNGNSSCDKGNLLTDTLMSDRIYQIFYKTGYKNYKFQQKMLLCDKVDNVRSYFDSKYSNPNFECDYHGEYINDSYRRYVTADLGYQVNNTLSLEQLIAEIDPECSAYLSDTDNDEIMDGIDNCKEVANNDQLDTDSDSFGDACDDDDDDDGLNDSDEINCGTNPLLKNSNTDGISDKDFCLCKDLSCRDNSKCIIDNDSPTCICDDGYKLNNDICTIIDKCKDFSCDNGKCSINNDSPICICDEGYKLENNICKKITKTKSSGCDYSNNGNNLFFIFLIVLFILRTRKKSYK